MHRARVLVQQIESIEECHKGHPIAKFWGKCNQQKWDLDRCLREEKALKRAVNFEKSKEEKARLLERRRAVTAPEAEV